MRKYFGVTRYEWAFGFPEPDWWGTIFRDVGAQSEVGTGRQGLATACGRHLLLYYLSSGLWLDFLIPACIISVHDRY